MRTLSIVSSALAGLAALSACTLPDAHLCPADDPAPATPPTVICEDAADASPYGVSAQPRTLTVTGFGVASGAPDVVHLQFGVQSRNVAAAAAIADNQARLVRVRTELAALGVAGDDIQIASRSLFPQAETDPATGLAGEPTAFVADNMVSVALRDPTRVDEALGKVFAAGATSIQSVQYMLDDAQRLTVEARARAMADARARAEQMAHAAGVDLGRPLSIQEQGGSLAPFPDMLGMIGTVTTPAPGQLQQTMSVSISYRIP